MSKNMRYGSLMRLIVLVTLWASLARAEEINERVIVSFECTKHEYVLGEPVWSMLVVSNATETNVEFRIGNGSHDSFVFFTEIYGKGSAEGLMPYTELGGLTALTILRPKEYLVREILLTDYIWLKAPGRYGLYCDVRFEISAGGLPVSVKGNYHDEIEVERDDDRLRMLLQEISNELSDPSARVRTRAVSGLASSRDPLCLPLLEQALADSDRLVVSTALRGIRAIGDMDARTILTQYAAAHADTKLGRMATQFYKELLRTEAGPSLQ